MKPAECSGRPQTSFPRVWFPHTIHGKSQRFNSLNRERTNCRFALCLPRVFCCSVAKFCPAHAAPCTAARQAGQKPYCNTEKYHQMAPLGKYWFASWFPSSDVCSKYSLVKCLWKMEKNLLWGRKNTSDETTLALSWILVYRVRLDYFYILIVRFWRQMHRFIKKRQHFFHPHTYIFTSADVLCAI